MNNNTNTTNTATTTLSALVAGTSSSGPARHTFSFDRVFCPAVFVDHPTGDLHHVMPSSDDAVDADDTQESVFSFLGPILSSHVARGFNAGLFAYGQTGSGKTHSMVGPPSLAYRCFAAGSSGGGGAGNTQQTSAVCGIAKEAGLIPRLCLSLFEHMRMEREANPTVTHQVHCSFFEIYCEKVRDLLTSSSSSSAAATQLSKAAPRQKEAAKLRIRQHPRLGPYVEGLQSIAVNDAVAVADLLSLGMNERSTAETKMNDHSSRSHAILQLRVTRVTVGGAGDSSITTVSTRSSKLNLVDLAGSERVNQTGATGDRLEEAKNINKSLHALGRVIQTLADRGAAATMASQSGHASLASSFSSAPSAAAAAAAAASSNAALAYRESASTEG